MSYLGYRIKVNGITLTDDWIQPGSFKTEDAKKEVTKWKDLNLTEHKLLLSTKRAIISFGIRVRTLSEQESLLTLFATQESVPVKWWDDLTCTYKEGTFTMDAPQFTHLNTKSGTILYNATTIKLTEV